MNMNELKEKLAARAPKRLREEGASLASVSLILSPAAAGDLEILFIRRAEHPQDPWSGQIGLPGGRRDEGDADHLATALRETREEAGIELDASQLLGELDDLHPGNVTHPPVIVRPFVFAVDKRPAIVPSREVAGHFWAAPEALARCEKETAVSVRGAQRRVEAYCVGPHTIWGMTRRIIAPFLKLIAG